MDPSLCANLKQDQIEAVALMLDALEAVVGETHVKSTLKIECRTALERGRAVFDPPSPPRA